MIKNPKFTNMKFGEWFKIVKVHVPQVGLRPVFVAKNQQEELGLIFPTRPLLAHLRKEALPNEILPGAHIRGTNYNDSLQYDVILAAEHYKKLLTKRI